MQAQYNAPHTTPALVRRHLTVVATLALCAGTTLIAAETCGRRARLIEYDPVYCDTIVMRWERLTGKHATLAETGETFEDIAEKRRSTVLPSSAPLGAHT